MTETRQVDYQARMRDCPYCGFVAVGSNCGKFPNSLSGTRKAALDFARRIDEHLPEEDRQDWQNIVGHLSTTFQDCGGHE